MTSFPSLSTSSLSEFTLKESSNIVFEEEVEKEKVSHCDKLSQLLFLLLHTQTPAACARDILTPSAITHESQMYNEKKKGYDAQ